MLTCAKCHSLFEIPEQDRQFYAQIDVPEPKKCPQCRMIRRMLERNPRQLYYRKCDFSKKRIISMYHELQPFPVYENEIWWSDKWDAMQSVCDANFSKPFFDQFKKLKNSVPHFAAYIVGGTLENSEFTNCTGYLKNCYLIAEADYNEDCYYSNRIFHSKNLCDCTNMYDSELCYQCMDCMNCYNLRQCQECQNCSDSWFLKNCIGCKDCIGCMNQRHQQYMIFNQKYSKEEYERKKAEFNLETYNGIQKLKSAAFEFFADQPHRAVQGENNENVIGDHVYNSKNAYYCFDCKDLEDCRYCAKVAGGVKNCMDYTSWGFKAELIYESIGCGDNAYNLKFCSTCTTNNVNLEYCFQCTGSNNLFGCAGLKRKQFCILNKQYSETEYKKLRLKIIEHMKRTGEWGEFFPMDLCDFGYNESFVMDHFPLTKAQALEQGYKWCDYEMPQPKVSDEILNQTIICEISKKPFKITQPELAFYKKMNLPLPRKHYQIRHSDRMNLRPPYNLWQKPCSLCGEKTYTTYSPSRPEKIYCEKCYINQLY